MLKKVPAAIVAVAILMTIPTVASWLHSESSVALVLTPGTAEVGVRSSEERVEFWLGRIQNDGDYLNRVRAAAALHEIARQTGDPDHLSATIAMADAALAANPASDDARIVRGAALNSDHRFGDALAEMVPVLERQPDSFRAHAIAGDARLELGEHDAARRHYDRLSAIQPGAPAVLSRLAELAWDTGRSTSALDLGTRALVRANDSALPPGELSFYAIRLARFRLETGDADGALELATAALDIAGHIPAVHSTLGLIHQAEGRTHLAIRSFEAAVEITPLPEAVAGLAELTN